MGFTIENHDPGNRWTSAAGRTLAAENRDDAFDDLGFAVLARWFLEQVTDCQTVLLI